MGNYTQNLNLYNTDMTTDGNDTFDFQRDLNDNNDKIDSAFGTLSTNVNGKVSKSGDTMTGDLIIANGSYQQLRLKNTAQTAGTLPNNESNTGVRFYDNADNVIGYIMNSYGTNGARALLLSTKNGTGTSTNTFKFGFDGNNNSYAEVNSKLAVNGQLTANGEVLATGEYKRKYPNTVSKGSNPTSPIYGSLIFIDGDSSHTTWQSQRLGIIEHSLQTNGDSYILIGAYKNLTNSTDNAGFKLTAPTSGNPYCTFPQTTCVDGQWVTKTLTITTVANSTSVDTYSLSDYLPKDNYSYEVMFCFYFYDTGDKCGSCYIESDVFLPNNATNNADAGQEALSNLDRPFWFTQANQNNRSISQVLAVPVGTGRYIKVKCTDANTQRRIYAAGYRRLGTNA